MFWRKRKVDDFSSEIESHLALEIERLQQEQGLTYDEARATAYREFGNVTKAQERFYESGRWLWLDHLWQDIRFALRMLRKSSGFTTVAVLTLALGIGATTGIFSVVNAVLIHDLPFRDPSSLVTLFQTPGKSTGLMGWAADGPDILDWQRESHTLSGVSASLQTGANITGGKVPQYVNGECVAANYFDLLGVRAAIGRTFSPSDERASEKEIVLSYGLWQTTFGGEDIVGHSIELDREPFTVIGIMPAIYHDPRTWSNPQSNYWILLPQTQLTANRGEHMYASFGRLASGATLTHAQQEMNVIAARDAKAFPDTNEGFGVRVSPLDQVNLQVFEGGHFESVAPAILVLQLAAGFLLLVACANIAGLMLSRALDRHREFAVRVALGADRVRIVRQLLTESVLLSVAGGAGGVLLSYWCAEALLASAPRGYLPPTAIVQLDVPVLAFAVGIASLIGILFGLAPALRASRLDVTEDLKSPAAGAGNSPSRLRARRWLVVFELAATLVLLIAGGLMVRSLLSLLRVNPGFDPHDFFTAGLSLPAQQYAKPTEILQFFSRVQRRVAALSGVQAVAFTSAPDFGVTSASDVLVEGEPTKNGTAAVWPQICVVTPNFFRATGIPLLQGRDFSPADADDGTHVAIVSEELSRTFWPHQYPLGKHVRCCGIPGWVSVVGVVADVHQAGLDAPPRPELYFPLTHETANGQNAMSIVVRTGIPPAVLTRDVNEQVAAIDSTIPLSDAHSGTKILADWSASFSYRATLLSAFGIMALLIAAIGLFGTISYIVAQRTHEIGLRMALGAQRGTVFRLIIFQGIQLIGLGMAIGLAGALALSRSMASLVYGVTASDPLTFVCIGVLLCAVALLACYIPARRAMRVDPITALRHE